MTQQTEKKHWINSDSFRSKIQIAYDHIIKGAEVSPNEAQTAQVFEQEVYYLLRSEMGVEPCFEKEHPVTGIHHTFSGLSNRKSGKERLDAVFNHLVIEYKHHSKLNSSSQQDLAIAQLQDYLQALYQQKKAKYDAILTDGIRICYFSFMGEEVRHTQLRRAQEKDIERIILAILNNNTKKFDPVNIVADYAISPYRASDTKRIAHILFEQLSQHATGKTSMLYEEWKTLMHLSLADNGKSSDIDKRRRDFSLIFNTAINTQEQEYQALFAMQTTYAILVKLIACKVIDHLESTDRPVRYTELINYPSDKMQEFFQMMEDGYTYTNMGVRNFLEGDYFSWYSDRLQWTYEFWDSIHKVMLSLDEYSAFSMDVQYNPIDIFKDLYMHIIPQSVRHSMGEYFTPEWLADSVIEGAMDLHPLQEWKAIDPCCGSGIFIISLIKKAVGNVCVAELSQEERRHIMDRVLRSVYGIDINPLSVLSARVSYFMALHQLGEIKNVEIPVYLGDSAVIPKKVMVDDIPCYQYEIDNSQHSFSVVLPQRLVNEKRFGEEMNKLQTLVQIEDSSLLLNSINALLTEQERESRSLAGSLQQLANDLVLLHHRNWDGIWVRIVTNFMMIARLQEFDYIVGNPPWVKWEHLPQTYSKKINSFCDVRHIFCNDGGMFGGAQLNICALISNVAATNWLSKQGVLAFLMPDSLMSQNSYEEYRNFYTDFESKQRMYLQRVDRWKAPLRPFRVGKKSVSQDFNTYFYSSAEVDYHQAGVPVCEITRKSTISDDHLNLLTSYSLAKQYLSFRSYSAKQLSTKSTAFTYEDSMYDFSKIIGETAYEYRTGVESTPFEVYKLVGVGESENKGHYRFKNETLTSSKYKVTAAPSDGWDLPTTHIYPMIEGPCVKPFSFLFRNKYHIVPYSTKNTKSPVSMQKLTETNMNLALYFAKQKDLLEKQAEKSKVMHCGNEFYALSKVGPYTFAPYMVAARDNTNFCATVVRPIQTQWGEKKQALCVKHTIIISQRIDKTFISAKEAHYINGILNSTIVHEYIHSTFKTNGFSLKKSNLKLPLFDPSNSTMKEIARISKAATEGRMPVDQAQIRLTDLYLKICS